MLANVSIGIINVLMTLVAMRAVDRWGRKPLLVWGRLVGMVSSLAVLGFTSLVLPEPTGIGPVGFVTLVCLTTFIASFAVSWGPAVWVMLPEILPLKIRGSAMGLANVLHFVANVMVSLSFPVLLASMGIDPLFLGFAVIGLFALVFTIARVTETKGRSLEQIEADLREKTLVT